MQVHLSICCRFDCCIFMFHAVEYDFPFMQVVTLWYRAPDVLLGSKARALSNVSFLIVVHLVIFFYLLISHFRSDSLTVILSPIRSMEPPLICGQLDVYLPVSVYDFLFLLSIYAILKSIDMFVYLSFRQIYIL